MDEHALRYAIVSPDEEFRGRVRRIFLKVDPTAELVADVPVSIASLGQNGLKQLHGRKPEVVLMDVAGDVVLSLQSLKWLSDQEPRRVFLLVGPPAEPAVLLEAMRAGAAEYLPQPAEEADISAAVSRAVRRLQGPKGGRAHGSVLAFFGGKGGSGVTTTATNVAVWLRRSTGKPTLLLDLDLDLGSAALLLGVQPRYTLVDVVRNFHRIDDDLLASYVERHDSGLHLLAPPSRLDLAHNFTRDQVESLVAYLRRSYTYIVVDLPRRISPATAAVFGSADQLYLVTTPEIPAIRNLKRFLSVLPSLTANGLENVRVVVNRRRQHADTISLSDIRQVLDLDVSWTFSEDPDGVLHSTNVGTPIVLNGASRYSKDVKAFCREIAPAPSEGADGNVLGAMGRLFRPFRRGEAKPPANGTRVKSAPKSKTEKR